MANADLQAAVAWACELHRDQWREGDVPIPYICHPLEVLSLLRYLAKVDDPVMMCAAVLHDVLEETTATKGQVKQRFGVDVASLVQELTRREPTAKQTEGLSADEVWALRSKMLLAEIELMSPRAQTVKLCDRLSNLRESAFTRRGKKLKRYRAQTKAILQIVPREVCPPVWRTLRAEAGS